MDAATRSFDRQILDFIRRFSNKPCQDNDFNALALELFNFQYARNEKYRQFCDLSGKNPNEIKNWKEIPAMPATGFKDLVLRTFPAKSIVKIFRTSGTTTSAKGRHYFDSLSLYEASILPPFQKFILFDKPKLDYFFLMESPVRAPQSSLSHMMGVVNHYFAKDATRFYIEGENVLHAKLSQDLKKSKHKAFLLATAFSLKAFIDFLKVKNFPLQLPKGSRMMETGGFKGKISVVSKNLLYRDCQKWLGIPPNFCFSEYGMTELSSQYYSQNGGSFQGPAWLRTLVMDPETGKEVPKGKKGALRHFDLANRGSVMAIQTEDIGRQKHNNLELLGRAKKSTLRGCSLDYERFLQN